MNVDPSPGGCTHAVANAFAMTIALALPACAALPAARSPHEIVEAERAFARLADEIGVRPAFVANFADDAVWMVPAPTSLRDAHAARPAPADPRAVRLEWAPAIAGIAASGELGYTLGPSKLSMRDGSMTPRHGVYFSVWKRDADGRWRVALDAGVQAPMPIEAAALQPAPVVHDAREGASRAFEALSAREQEPDWDRRALRAALADDALLIANDMPVVRGAAIAEALAVPFSLEPLGGAIAATADLAYSYGRWQGATAHGHYVHLWTRDAHGRARVAVVVRLP